MSDRRVLGFAWLGLSLILWLVLRDFCRWGFAAFDIANARMLGQVEMSALVAIGATFAIALIAWKRKDVYSFGIETVEETRKVVWPSRKETRDNTVIVVITSFIMAVILGFFDLVWAKLSGFILYAG